MPPISLFYNSDDTANTARAEWVAGQYRDILGIEITLEPTEGTALVELRKEPIELADAIATAAKANDVIGPDAQAKAQALGDGQVLLLENVRFEKGETKGDPELADVALHPEFGALSFALAMMFSWSKCSSSGESSV